MKASTSHLIAGLLILFSAVCVYLGVQSQQKSSDTRDLEVTPKIADLGECKWREQLTAKFTIKNTTTLTIRWDAGYEADEVLNEMPLLYECKDGRRGSTTISMKVNVAPDIRIKPQKLLLAEVKIKPVELQIMPG